MFIKGKAVRHPGDIVGYASSFLEAIARFKTCAPVLGQILIADTREKAIEEGRRSYAARTAKSFFQVQSNPAFDTWVANGAFGSPQMVAEWLLPWFKIRKTVPSMSTLIVRFCSLDDVTQARRFHEEVMPLIRHAL